MTRGTQNNKANIRSPTTTALASFAQVMSQGMEGLHDEAQRQEPVWRAPPANGRHLPKSRVRKAVEGIEPPIQVAERQGQGQALLHADVGAYVRGRRRLGSASSARAGYARCAGARRARPPALQPAADDDYDTIHEGDVPFHAEVHSGLGPLRLLPVEHVAERTIAGRPLLRLLL